MHPLRREYQQVLTGPSEIKLIRSDAGEYYAYCAATGVIYTMRKDRLNAMPEADRQEAARRTLAEAGVLPSASVCFERDWSTTEEEYFRCIESHIPVLVLETTCQCNLRCSYCIYSGNYPHARTHQNRQMSAETARESVDFYRKHNQDCSSAAICFYGGEALLGFPVIADTVAYAREAFAQKPLRFDISTNGTLLNKKILDWLAENPDVTVTVTLNGDAHDGYRQFPSGEGSLRTVLGVLDTMKRDYPDVWQRQLRLISNIASAAELLPLRRFFGEKVGKSPELITRISPDGGNEVIDGILACDESEERACTAQVRDAYIRDNNDFLNRYYYLGLSDIHSRPLSENAGSTEISGCCMPFRAKLFVGTDRSFNVCEKISGNSSLGNLDGGFDFAAIKTLLSKTRRLYSESCSSCWAARLCRICYSELLCGGELPERIPGDVCRRERNRVFDNLTAYVSLAETSPERLKTLRPSD